MKPKTSRLAVPVILMFLLAILMATASRAAEPPDLERGAALWGKCRACHTYEKGGPHLVGPNLWDMFGEKAGTAKGYVYSEAMKEADIVWTEETLDKYLAATQDYIPGSKMYGGLAIEQNRIDLIAWLKSVAEPDGGS